MNALSRAVTFMLLFVLLTAATMRTTGLDYPVYAAEFLDPVNNLSSHEVGYVALITAVGTFTGFWLVLLVSNLVFFVCHRPLLHRTRTPVQCVALIFYLSYVGLFLIYGSPRRLIAYSIVAYVVQKIVFDPSALKRRPLRHLAFVAAAAAFHASAFVFLPVVIAYAYGRSLLHSRRKLGTLVLAALVVSGVLYASGVVDYLLVKIAYYAFDAASEQEYLEDVPSVTSGLLKRVVALALLWWGTRGSPHLRRPIFDFCFMEAMLYGTLGSVSPVLAVVSSYFSLGYLLPLITIRSPGEMISRRNLAFVAATAIYYLPTSIGLIRQFGSFYVS